MQRVLATILAAVLVLAGTAWASDIHVEGPYGEHTSLGKTGGGEQLPDDLGHCGHCCHGAAHHVALIRAEAGLLSLPHASVSFQNDTRLIGLPRAPPNH